VGEPDGSRSTNHMPLDGSRGPMTEVIPSFMTLA
jgi:hypothetical protein